jgi:hypothetical protein
VSGGKDSTALALRLAEVEPRDYVYLITPTGDELPEMVAHWERLERLLGKPLTRVTNGTLKGLIQEFGALPNHRQRWCTRMLKIQPTIAFLARHAPAINYVGLRADEEERRGIYGDVPSRYPLREWGWGLTQVKDYLRERGVTIPERTDCARCYGQRLIEWKRLLTKHPAIYADAEVDEARTGHTFRSPQRDTWPAALKDLRAAFDSGRRVRGEQPDEDGENACRVCSL